MLKDIVIQALKQVQSDCSSLTKSAIPQSIIEAWTTST
ncbi:hypothetical protein JCM19232_294 [Vibrio ishigakensis]|uniref:Uncharacterized protein n=1 Tax=Vibrio ishigakensis TaxID=1481914 RepID=A0A0B8P196_9VIBR|nr:hypothetical protein JCM19232_294 [Vibrio ishigakensis]